MLIQEFVIMAVKQFPQIYDMGDKDYKDPVKKSQAFHKISSYLQDCHGSLSLSGDQVKEIWAKLVAGYKDFVLNGKKMPPSGAGAQTSSISKTTNDLYKFMSFLDGKMEHHAQMSSAPTTTSKASKSPTKRGPKKSIWDEDLECLSSDEEVVPPVDKFCREKRRRKSKNQEDDLSQIFGCVKDLTTVLKENLSKGGDDAYKRKISSFFENLDEKQRNLLMQKLLKIINEEIS